MLKDIITMILFIIFIFIIDKYFTDYIFNDYNSQYMKKGLLFMFINIKENMDYAQDISMMITDAFNGFYSVDDTIELINKSFISLGYIENNILIGYAGLLEMYSNITFELHPLIVKAGYRSMGVGSEILKEIEREAKLKNALNIMLGSDDEYFKTNLHQFDFNNSDISYIFNNIKNIDNHPYEFYQKNGYKIVGIFPNANGIGKPDIWLWKQLL